MNAQLDLCKNRRRWVLMLCWAFSQLWKKPKGGPLTLATRTSPTFIAEVNFDILQPTASHSVSDSCTGSSHFFSSIWNLDSALASLPATGGAVGGLEGEMCASIWQLWQFIYYINDLCMNDSPLRISRDILRNRCRDKAKTLSLFSHSII